MLKIFLSYSHADENLKDELNKHLALLKREGLIDTWNDRRIEPGANIHSAIDEELEQASIILLLISADFISSDYCYSNEMNKALERHQNDKAKVVPIILRDCDWHSAPFGSLNALPKDGTPVNSFHDKDQAMANIVRELRSIVGKILNSKF